MNKGDEPMKAIKDNYKGYEITYLWLYNKWSVEINGKEYLAYNPCKIIDAFLMASELVGKQVIGFSAEDNSKVIAKIGKRIRMEGPDGWPGFETRSESVKEKILKIVLNRSPSHYDNAHAALRKRYAEGLEPWNKGKPFLQKENHPLWGTHHSPETRKKMRDHHWSRTRPKEFQEFMERSRPNCPTVQEDILYEAIRHQYTVIRQKQVGKYCCDFYILELNLIIEIDGYKKPPERDEFIRDQGFHVVHFTNKEIESNLQECVSNVAKIIRKA